MLSGKGSRAFLPQVGSEADLVLLHPNLYLLAMSLAEPTQEDVEELLLSCRYGDVEDIQQFIGRCGPDALATARDGNGNTVLHMVAGNGHTGTFLALYSSPWSEAAQAIDMRKTFHRSVRLSPSPGPDISPLCAE